MDTSLGRDSRGRWLKLVGLTAALGAGMTVWAPTTARACGGTFCDAGVPQPMPVDQTGENVIFVLGDTEAEVHIQIAIDPNTNAQQFAWMVPLAAVPDFSVGSQPLFTNVLNGSVPTYGIQNTFESCDFDDGGRMSGPVTRPAHASGAAEGFRRVPPGCRAPRAHLAGRLATTLSRSSAVSMHTRGQSPPQSLVPSN